MNNNKSLQEIERCSNFYLIEKIFSIENRKYIELKKKQFKGDVSFSGDLIQRTTLSIYEARTGHSVSELTDIDVAALMPDDFDTIIELIRIAKDCNASSQIKELTDIIRRKIAI